MTIIRSEATRHTQAGAAVQNLRSRMRLCVLIPLVRECCCLFLDTVTRPTLVAVSVTGRPSFGPERTEVPGAYCCLLDAFLLFAHSRSCQGCAGALGLGRVLKLGFGSPLALLLGLLTQVLAVLATVDAFDRAEPRRLLFASTPSDEFVAPASFWPATVEDLGPCEVTDRYSNLVSHRSADPLIPRSPLALAGAVRRRCCTACGTAAERAHLLGDPVSDRRVGGGSRPLFRTE